MTRFPSLICLLLLLRAVPVHAGEAQLDANESVFTTLAALVAAGPDVQPEPAATYPLRKAIRDAILARNPPSLAEIRSFVAARRKRDATADLSQYVSFALVNEGPPSFRYKLQPNELPPDVVGLQGLETLLQTFYGEASIGELWKRSQTAFDKAIAQYHEPVTRAVMEVNGYLRNPTSGYLGRRFQIYVDLLGAPNQVQTRSYKDDYYVVVTVPGEAQIEQIRHAYLHYLLDPLALKYSDNLNKKRSMLDAAQAAPALEESYKDDFVLLATESLIKAVESRLHPPAERRQIVDRAARQGFVLTPAFAEALPAYEKQTQALRLYFPELAGAIDLRREAKRFENFEFASTPDRKPSPATASETRAALSGLEKLLEDAEQLYRARELNEAKAKYVQALEQNGAPAEHARAYYGLGRIAALQKNPELAERMFQKALDSGPDLDTKSWSLIYLGRLSGAAGENHAAVQRYRAALALEGLQPAARAAAEQSLQESLAKGK